MSSLSTAVSDYLSLVEKFCSVMEQSYDVQMSPGIFRKGDVPKQGSIMVGDLGMARYDFHGAGCRIVFPTNIIVDFDFEARHEVKKIDPWKLWWFIDSVPGEFGFLSKAEFEHDFQKL